PVAAPGSQWALLGISDGGSAAINLAFKHPDRFGACAGHSGTYQLYPEHGLEAVLGGGSRADSVCAANSPVRYVGAIAPRLRGMRIYFDCGLFDLAFLDDRSLHHQLLLLELPHLYREFWGFHTWFS